MAYQSEYTGIDIDKGVSLALAMYPVGSIYLSVNNVNPGAIFGGTWEQIQDRFLLAAGGTYAGGTMGGTASHTHTTVGHTLTASEMPSHTHTGRIAYKQSGYGYTPGDWEIILSSYASPMVCSNRNSTDQTYVDINTHRIAPTYPTGGWSKPQSWRYWFFIFITSVSCNLCLETNSIKIK